MSIRPALAALLVATLALSLTPSLSAADKGKDPPSPGPTPNPGPGPLPVRPIPSFATEPFDRANVNGDAGVNLADGMYILNYLFASLIEPPPPFGYCGYDPTPDDLSCNASPAGCPAPSCPDLAVTDLSVEVLLRHAYGRDVRITATMVNLGSTYQGPGTTTNERLVLKQNGMELASLGFDTVPAGYSLQLTFDTTWDNEATDPLLWALFFYSDADLNDCDPSNNHLWR